LRCSTVFTVEALLISKYLIDDSFMINAPDRLNSLRRTGNGKRLAYGHGFRALIHRHH
jgi:hypothetical protein